MKLLYYWHRFVARPWFYVMKVLGRFTLLRRLAPRVLNRHLAKPPLRPQSLFPDLDPAAAARTVAQDGVCFGVDLPPEAVAGIRDYAMRNCCFGEFNPRHGFPYAEKAEAERLAGRHFVIGNYFNAAAGCASIQQVERDPKLWAIAEEYFGTTPRHIGNSLWWSFAGERTQAEKHLYAQLFHYDLDDYVFLKFFFYLTDVDGTKGPHVCVRGSHRRKRLDHRLRYRRFADDEITSYYGVQNVLAITGKAGTGFAEDTYCIHKGTPPAEGDRLILQVQFALNDYGLQHDFKDPAELGRLV